MNSRRLFCFFSAFCALATFTLGTQAAPADVSGTWKWEVGRPGGETRAVTAELKQEGTKVTGSIARPQGAGIQIEDGKIAEDGTLSFVTKVERNDRTLAMNYKGKVAGDKITGQTEFTTRNGQTRTRDWTATREGGKLTGKWQTVRELDNGSRMEFNYNLKQEGEKLTGTTSVNDSEPMAIRNGKVQGNEISFQVVRERDGRSFTADYKGKLEGDKIVGNVDVDWGDGTREFDWEAKKVK